MNFGTTEDFNVHNDNEENKNQTDKDKEENIKFLLNFIFNFSFNNTFKNIKKGRDLRDCLPRMQNMKSDVILSKFIFVNDY